MAEWTKAIDSKSIRGPKGSSGVRIPLPPSPTSGPRRPKCLYSGWIEAYGEVRELVESARLESVCTSKGYRGFESHPLRQRSGSSRRRPKIWKIPAAQAILPLRTGFRAGPKAAVFWTIEDEAVLGGEVAVPCRPQSAIAGLNPSWAATPFCKDCLTSSGVESWVQRNKDL
jgi:hypothetical protein